MSEYNSPEINRYVDFHKDPSGPGDSRPTALRIIEDNDLKGKLTDKTIIITGCSSGIGVETARALSTTGARLFLTARNLDKGRETLSGILEPGRVELLHLDLNSLASIRSFSREFLAASNGRLNVLITNAGIMTVPEGTTADGFERQFGTNHLAHFLLFQLVKDALLASSTPEFNSRVVALSSLSHRIAPPNMSNLMLKGAYNPHVAYAHSKTANIWMANEIDRKYGKQGLHALSVHPGIIDTGLQASAREEFDAAVKGMPALQKALKNKEQGAAPSVWAAVGKCWEGKGGVYLEDCTVAQPHHESSGPVGPGYAEWAYDEEKEKTLWKLSNEWVGITE